jgi:hypothetical protein
MGGNVNSAQAIPRAQRQQSIIRTWSRNLIADNISFNISVLHGKYTPFEFDQSRQLVELTGNLGGRLL